MSELAAQAKFLDNVYRQVAAYADENRQLRNRIKALKVENARLKALLILTFNRGYQYGHHATVEGQYVDILDEDMDTYHDDIVNEILSE
jgi:cell shape-determining protein MreC